MDDYSNEYLAHYGVLGMKWGVRHDPQRAYTKASKKVNRYKKRIEKNDSKAARNVNRAITKSAGIFRSEQKANKYINRSNKFKRRSLRTAYKADKWIKRMEKEFSKQSVVSLDQSVLDFGRQCTDRITRNADQIYMRSIY